MKLSFSLPSKTSSSKPSSKPKPSQGFIDESSKNEQPNHEYVTEFDASKTLTLGESNKKTIVIPPKENEWRPYKKMKNLDLPSIKSADGKPLEFEVESADIATDADEKMSYGLNLRQNSGKGDVGDASNSVDAILLKKLKSDLDRLPEDEGFEQFEEVPVEGFGAALLAGYGWHEGRGIGRNAKEDVKVVEYKRRTAKEGLGFHADHGAKVKDELRTKKREDDESKRENSAFSVGKEVRIVSGREMGLKGKVLELVPGGGSLILRLSLSEEEVKVGVNEVAELGSEEEEKCLKKLKELKIQSSKDDAKRSDRKSKDLSRERKESKRSREVGARRDIGEVKHERVQRDERKTSRVSWLRSHIRVRIISKEFKGGRFYLKKGEVVDVVGPTTCDISIDDGREIVQGVDQDILETALPRRGGPVLVLFGKHKGVYGSLVEKDTDRETGVVEDADTRELLHVRLEQIAEYMGDPSYIGY
uniref:G-patch domain-containing protein n=1 Tax=Opuntia streptacantha TaxID=393608 RepID=A0A7C8YWM7_OPUST